MDSSPSFPGKKLGLYSLVMMNVVAVASLRSLPMSAQFGTALLFFYGLASLVFFIPLALITAQLATTCPQTGGAYIWVRMAFGPRWGFFAIGLQWIYNVVWYPTILAFIGAILAHAIHPAWAANKWFMFLLITIIWWGVTIISCAGMHIARWWSGVGAIFGSLLPLLVIIILGLIWAVKGNPLALDFSWKQWWPHDQLWLNLGYLTSVFFALMGIEISAVHAGDVRDPQRQFPRALFYSVVLSLVSLVLGSYSLAAVLSLKQLNILSSVTDAFVLFLSHYHLELFLPVVLIAIVIGSLSSVSTWAVGPTRGLLIAAQEQETSPWIRSFLKTNRFNMPIYLLMGQGLLVTLLASFFIFIPVVNGAYWLLSAMTAQLALIYYLILFLAFFKLRNERPKKGTGYRIPGGAFSQFMLSGLGVSSCLLIFILGFFPPRSAYSGSLLAYCLILISGIVVFALIPLLFFFLTKKKK